MYFIQSDRFHHTKGKPNTSEVIPDKGFVSLILGSTANLQKRR